jgi:hypothetical protein
MSSAHHLNSDRIGNKAAIAVTLVVMLPALYTILISHRLL